MRTCGCAIILLIALALNRYHASAQEYAVYLIGDAGKDTISGPALQMLDNLLTREGKNASVIFLGDNVYPRGLEKPGSHNRKITEKKILSQLQVVDSFTGKFFMIPGNHDWRKSGWKGLQQLSYEEEFINAYFSKKETTIANPSTCFLPSNGLPGPSSIQLDSAAKLRLIIYDPQWWLHQQSFHKVGSIPNHSKQELQSQFFKQLNKELQSAESNSETVIIAGHHPLMTAGEHARLSQPLHFITTYVPPFQVFRLFGLNRLFRQDLQSNAYRKLADSMLAVIQQRQALIYAAGHDHNLQYSIDKMNNVFIVSGAGSSTTPFDPKASYRPDWKDDRSTGFFKLIFNATGLKSIYVFTLNNPEGISLLKDN